MENLSKQVNSRRWLESSFAFAVMFGLTFAGFGIIELIGLVMQTGIIGACFWNLDMFESINVKTANPAKVRWIAMNYGSVAFYYVMGSWLYWMQLSDVFNKQPPAQLYYMLAVAVVGYLCINATLYM